MKAILPPAGTLWSIQANQLIVILWFTLLISAINCTTTYANFQDLGNGTVLDEEHSLLWQQSDDSVLRNLQDAYSYCKNLTIGNNSEWELPSASQLEKLIDLNRYPTIDPIFSAQPSIYLTISIGHSMLCMDEEYSNSSRGVGTFAVINFDNGNIFNQPDDCITEPADGFTRCVSEYKEPKQLKQFVPPILDLLLSQ